MRLLGLGAVTVTAAIAAVAGLVAADIGFDQGRFVVLALGRNGLVKSCSETLTGRLAQRGFEPADLDLEAQPTLDVPWRSVRSVQGHFTFLDGPEQTRVDGVMACLVGPTGVTVEFRVASVPHRDA